MKKLKITLQFKIIIFILLLSFLYSFYFNVNFKSKYTNEKIIYGYITHYLIDGNKLTIYLDGKEKVLCKYYFKTIYELNQFKEQYKLGDYIKLDGSLKEPSNNTIFNNFNYKEYLRYERINYIFEISKITKLKDNSKIKYKIKNIIIDLIEKNENKDYLYAFILGNSKYIDSNVMESYRINGIIHLFAVSGMHISLLTVIFIKLLDKVKIKDIVIVFLVIFYMFLANYSSSILRAGIFYILILINKKYKLKISNINLMILLLSICIFIDPFIIYKIGFQYSYLISFTLILFNKMISNIKNKITKLFTISFISFIVSLPITINNFYQINILSIFLNIIFVPLISSIIFPLTILSLIIPLNFLQPIIHIFENISLFLSKIDIFILILPKINIIVIIIYYVVIFYTLYNIKNKKYNKIFLLILIILIHYISPYFNNNTEITFIDVGQGDSIFIKFKNKANILIDTGGIIKYDKEEWEITNSNYSMSNSIITYLKSIGIRKIDYLILSHGDYDHMGESLNLINNYKVEKVIFNNGEYNDLELELIKSLENNNILYYKNIKELNINNNILYFINNNLYNNENDNSIVIYTKINNYKILLMADAGIKVEEDLIEKYNLKDIDILKIGHHGSKTSSKKEFIDEINPKYSVISVGKDNRYNHPNDEVLENIKNSYIYRTDIDGSIMFKFKKYKLETSICPP